jgi:aminomuconate-semialdehyde/2-hydroxymuconate-6-semialdehyde dehydrogenase
LADAIEAKLPTFAEAETTDTGKPLQLATTVDIPRAVANFRFFATAILHQHTKTHSGSNSLNYTHRSPLGVAVCISPWNLPLYLFSWKIAPALAAGCTVVGKPSEITPYTAHLLAEVLQEIGFPAGVLNIVHGRGNEVGQALVEHPQVKAVSFTGGTATGAAIARAVAPQFKKISLELGGKNPFIVFDDAPDEVVDTAVHAAFRNQGQICLCGSRFLIHQNIYDSFKERFLKKVAELQPADPLADGTEFGALTSEAHQQKVLQYIELAKAEGATVLAGGEAAKLSGRCTNGYFVQPTVLEGLPADCRINQEEIFGPVVSLMPFSTEEEALELANSTDYGLAASLWTQHLGRAHRLSHQLDFGIVWVNCWMLRDLRTPFGGTKNSGLGREGGFEALEFFTEEKNICLKF